MFDNSKISVSWNTKWCFFSHDIGHHFFLIIGKILYFVGNIKKFQIGGVELNNEIYKDTLFLKDLNIDIFNENILDFKLDNKEYDLLIINDPLKRIQDFESLIKKIKTINYKVFIVMININSDKIKIANDNLEIISNKFFSKNRNVLFFKKN